VKRFSQRKGLTPVPTKIQVDGMSAELKNSLWNTLDMFISQTEDVLFDKYGNPGIKKFSTWLWFNFFKEPIDSIPKDNRQTLEVIREKFFSYKWFEVYDFIEFVINYLKRPPGLIILFNKILEKELSGYRIISGTVAPITDEQEVKMLTEELQDTQFGGASAHLKSALGCLSDRKKPDYRNSIKESISAVESIARIITNSPKATLGEALNILEKKGKLHPALKKGFSSLYGYTSDEGGIRHAMSEEPNLTAADAKFFLLSCTSFVNYLKTKIGT